MKRVIFSLLFDNGQFVLSRNFRQQKVGDIDWVMNNYNLLNVSCGVDELVILDVGKTKNPEEFSKCIKIISNSCFVPLAAGGGIHDLETAKKYINSGADKLVLNSAFYTNPELPRELAQLYGSQCIIASIDYQKKDDRYVLYSASDLTDGDHTVSDHLEKVQAFGAGEIMCQSFQQDGTGMGLDLVFAEQFLKDMQVPCITLGGVGKTDHILEGLQHPFIDAVCTANLLNFIGDTFERSRTQLLENGLQLPEFSSRELMEMKNHFAV